MLDGVGPSGEGVGVERLGGAAAVEEDEVGRRRAWTLRPGGQPDPPPAPERGAAPRWRATPPQRTGGAEQRDKGVSGCAVPKHDPSGS
jgi:hypothetical protein